MIYFIFWKTFVATACCTKDVNVGGNHLTQVNYGNIQNETKLIDSLKFYQKKICKIANLQFKKICKIFNSL